ncbi:MAG: hypothetical protein R3D68_14425 [Hyphomicrobiaceae bacterium]
MVAEIAWALLRATVLPLVERVASQLAHWLAPAYAPAAGGQPRTHEHDATLKLVPDLDTLPALAPEREALWAALEKTSFLTTEEERALAGFSPAPRADAQWASEAPPKSADAQWASEARLESLKFNPGQPGGDRHRPVGAILAT